DEHAGLVTTKLLIVNWFPNLEDYWNGMSMNNIFLQYVLGLSKSLEIKGTLCIFVSFMHHQLFLLDIANLLGPYFERIEIRKYKYYLELRVYIIFHSKLSDWIDSVPAELVRTKEKIVRLFNQSEHYNYNEFYPIFQEYYQRVRIYHSVGTMILSESSEVQSILDKVNMYQEIVNKK